MSAFKIIGRQSRFGIAMVLAVLSIAAVVVSWMLGLRSGVPIQQGGSGTLLPQQPAVHQPVSAPREAVTVPLRSDLRGSYADLKDRQLDAAPGASPDTSAARPAANTQAYQELKAWQLDMGELGAAHRRERLAGPAISDPGGRYASLKDRQLEHAATSTER